MITGGEVLLTVAQIGLGLAGFGSLVSIFVDAEKGWGRMDVVRFRFLIGISLLSVFFSLLPFLFVESALPEPQVWQLSSSIVALVAVVATGFGFFATYGAFTSEGSPFWSSVAVVFGVSIIVSQIANALGLGFEKSFTGYFFGLFLTIDLAGMYFIRMILIMGPTLKSKE
jgi:drug/metabolite transporter (DMT)-like permease